MCAAGIIIKLLNKIITAFVFLKMLTPEMFNSMILLRIITEYINIQVHPLGFNKKEKSHRKLKM